MMKTNDLIHWKKNLIQVVELGSTPALAQYLRNNVSSVTMTDNGLIVYINDLEALCALNNKMDYLNEKIAEIIYNTYTISFRCGWEII